MVHYYKLSFLSIVSAFLVIACFSVSTFAQSQSERPTIEYNFPMNGSKYVPSNTPIILRPTLPVALPTASKNLIVTGTMTGRHDGTMILSDDNRTLIFTPTDPFESGERVTVSLGTGVAAANSVELAPISFSFEVQDNEQSQSPFLEHTPANFDAAPLAANRGSLPPRNPIHTLSGDTMLSVVIDSNASPGYLFFATFNSQAFSTDTGSAGANRIVLDKNGNTVYLKPALDRIDWDFQPQPNGLMTFYSMQRDKWYAMDSNYIIVDSFRTTSPYTADFHDLELLTHHHALMLSYYPIKPYDLSKYGGSDTATFIGGVIEEIDSLKNPIWIWRSWDPDHYLDTDATYDLPSETLQTPPTPFDAVHENSIQIDTDGNILLSARALDEVSKISRKDGSFIWRLGGKHNQFTFIGDSIHFSHQHAVRRIANGDITLFDNGNYNHTAEILDTDIFPPDTNIYTNPPDTVITPADTEIGTNLIPTFARACEYDVDTNDMTAKLVWYYDDDSTIASQAMGYVQRLPDGNTLINWGLDQLAGSGLPQIAVTEVTPDKRITFEMDASNQITIYRAFKFPSPNYDTGFVAPASQDTLLPSAVATESSYVNSPELGSPFPNPSNGSSTVTITATPSDRLELDLYDPLGRLARTYFSGIASSTTFSLELLTGDLPNGAYELVLRGMGGTVSRQFDILR
jgi:hypothetical protein